MRKLNITVYLFLLMFTIMAVITDDTSAQEQKNKLLDMFQDERDAVKHNCAMVNLKDAKNKNCVLQRFEDHELRLIIYDRDAYGKFTKSQELCIPSWYQKAKVEFVDLIGDGRQFIFATFEGNTGTGTLQMIIMMIGWHNSKFMPVLAETVEYSLSERGDIKSLKMSYEIKNKKSPKASVELKYKFMAEDKNEYPHKFNAAWADKLSWNEKTYSFYDEKAEAKKFWNVPHFINKNISDVRLSIRNVDSMRLCTDFFDKTRIMYILDNKE